MHKFHTVVILRASAAVVSNTGNPYVAEFARQLDQARKQKGKVYQTYVDDQGKKKFVFVTTSKDVHLGLGMLTNLGQSLLAKQLEYEFRNKTFGQLMLNLPSESGDENDEKSVLVAMTEDRASGETCFGLSPAH